MRTVTKESTGQPLHDCSPPYDVVPADWTGLNTLPALVTHQVIRDTLVDPHSLHFPPDTQKGHLKRHIESVHEKVKYPCNQCEKQFTVKRDVKRHVKSVHEKI